jgi:hypothetical protein
MTDSGKTRHKGSCDCGGVQFEVHGELEGVTACYCTQCQKTHGNFAVYARAQKGTVELTHATGLKWYNSSEIARRGFCNQCGGSIFFERHEASQIAIAAGMLEQPTGLTIAKLVHCDTAPDYLPKREEAK